MLNNNSSIKTNMFFYRKKSDTNTIKPNISNSTTNTNININININKPVTNTNTKTIKKSDEVIEMPKNINCYLGQKGYTILKSDLTIKQQTFIKEQLTVKPYVPGSPVQVQKSFAAYRESDKKMYLPRYYGEEIFGKAKEIKIPEGDDISLTFNGQLRDYQAPVVQKYLDHVAPGGGGLLELYCGWGKCLAFDTPVIMYDGEIKKVQDIKIGDILMGDDSKPRNVLSLARGKEQMYRITNIQGDTYTVNESHILSLKCSSNYGNKYKKGEIIDISVKEYLKLPKTFHGKGGLLLGYKVGIDFPKRTIEFDPYLLGYWLGDGASDSPKITTQESTIIKYIVDIFKTKYIDLYLSYHSEYNYRICGIKHHQNSFLSFLRNNNLLKNKHIPDSYKYNDRQIRLQLLAGIIDSDGYNKGNCYEIIQKNCLLSEDIVYLCRSLGFACYSKKCKKKCYNSKDGPKEGEYNRISIYGSGLEEIPVLCLRKKCSIRKQIKDSLSSRIKIEKLDVDNYYGFCIDGNHRFLLGNFTVTHNSDATLYIIAALGKKALIIVHKEFLMNQWIERINKYYPNAKIGKIQGQTIDIDGKDIVLCMLQSLSMKDYPASLFDSFGLTIIDEVHHISSEVFSCALFKLVTKYMLGLSATMNRSDGTTKVFKMFLGEVVYKKERDKDEKIIVRGITYEVNDDEYNELETDFRGKPASSKMLSKICTYNRRTEFILKVLNDMILENPKQQIMVIASYRNILNYIFDAINHKNMATVGYYVGGMKESALKLTESKQIVLATFSMAAEGLDIKSLSTLFMVTPMTKIEQAVGRILRQKHDFNPVVVDIIDTHANFQNQWKKRKLFYKKQNYKIIQTNSSIYVSDVSKWKTTFEPVEINSSSICKPKIVNKEPDDISDDEVISESDSDSDPESDSSNNDKNKGKCLLKFKK
jgi:superfamily II DNA or RNA helicase